MDRSQISNKLNRSCLWIISSFVTLNVLYNLPTLNI
jgi:uncharacterized membrane protein YesL